MMPTYIMAAHTIQVRIPSACKKPWGAAMMDVGIIFAMGGFKDGTAVFGFPLLILSVLDAWLPLIHKGYWGLLAGIFVAVGAFQTARTRQCPVNGLMGVNTAQGSA